MIIAFSNHLEGFHYAGNLPSYVAVGSSAVTVRPERLEHKVIAYLNHNITAIANRTYGSGLLVQARVMPALTVQRISNPPADRSHTGPGLRRSRIQISCYHSAGEECEDVAMQVSELMRTFYIMGRPAFELNMINRGKDANTHLYQWDIDFEIMHRDGI